MLRLEISQVAFVDLSEIIIVGPSRKIVEDDEHRDHTAVFHYLASDRPLIVAYFTVASAEVLVPLVVRPVHTSSVAAVGSRFIHTVVALIVRFERVWTTGAVKVRIIRIRIALVTTVTTCTGTCAKRSVRVNGNAIAAMIIHGRGHDHT